MGSQCRKPIASCSAPLTGRRGPRTAARQDGADGEPRRVKLTVVGDGMVGKTCLLFAFINKRCPSEEYMPTVFETTSLDTTVDGQAVQLSLWDTAGQEEYSRLRRLIYPSTDIFLLCYAVNCTTSFENVTTKWWPELRHYCPKTPIVLVATKTDLRGGRLRRGRGGVLDRAEGRRLGRRLGAQVLECSALSYEGVPEVFEAAVRSVLGSGGPGRPGRGRQPCPVL